jgi:peptidyl-prolyl cis-trans isomerase SurA
MLSRVFSVLFCLSFLLVNAQTGEDVLMTVGTANVKVSEFKYIYEKNNGGSADYSAKSVNEYLDLYTKFKLKVEKAKDLKLDTISALKSELEGYRKQLASSYLIDKEVTDFLLMELYDRMKTDVAFSHIFIPVAENSTNAVREEAKSKINEVKLKLTQGNKFEDLAQQFSQDKTTATKGGDMGFFTAKLPAGFYELESALYNTKVGETSDILKTKIGYHIIKVNNKRPARGSIEVAHILLDPESKTLADSIHNALKGGANFENLVTKYSKDKNSVKNSGKLPIFGINTYDKSFEDAAYNINDNGGFSSPVMTKSGWHIIKRLNKPNMDTYELFVKRNKAQIGKDPRFDIAKTKLIIDIKKSSGFVENLKELQLFAQSLDEEFYSFKWAPKEGTSTNQLFAIGGSNMYSIKDFADFCKKNTKTRLKYDKSKPLIETVEELYNEYVNETVMAYEEKSLEIKYPDFKSLMREYEEGILLFEATKINVWDRANQDTVGLKAFFETKPNIYMWDEKAEVIEYSILTNDKGQAEKIYEFAAKNNLEKVENKFNKKTKMVATKKVEFEKGSKEITNLEWKQDALSNLDFNNKDTFTFKKINKIIGQKPKTLAEAKGYVVADYQDYLEKEWLLELSKSYQVKVNSDVLAKLIKK